MTSLADGVVVLTGASRGIGAAIARDLAAPGVHLVLAARNAEQLLEVAGEVEARGATATVVPTDVTDAAGREALIATVVDLGPIAALILNAGVETPVAVVDHTAEEVATTLDVNLHATIELTRLALPAMIGAQQGAIVIVSSMSGKAPTPWNAIYTATKFGLVGFTGALRIELHGTGVQAGVVCPSFVAEAGMFHDTGVTAGGAIKAVPMDQVTRAVRRVLGGSAEVLVTPMPTRPLLALGQLLPGIEGRVLGWLGVLETLKERARVVAARRKS